MITPSKLPPLPFWLSPCMPFLIFNILSTVTHESECPPQIQVLHVYSLADGTVWEVAKLIEARAMQQKCTNRNRLLEVTRTLVPGPCFLVYQHGNSHCHKLLLQQTDPLAHLHLLWRVKTPKPWIKTTLSLYKLFPSGALSQRCTATSIHRSCPS